jgi:hypothetical protein
LRSLGIACTAAQCQTEGRLKGLGPYRFRLQQTHASKTSIEVTTSAGDVWEVAAWHRLQGERRNCQHGRESTSSLLPCPRDQCDWAANRCDTCQQWPITTSKMRFRVWIGWPYLHVARDKMIFWSHHPQFVHNLIHTTSSCTTSESRNVRSARSNKVNAVAYARADLSGRVLECCVDEFLAKASSKLLFDLDIELDQQECSGSKGTNYSTSANSLMSTLTRGAAQMTEQTASCSDSWQCLTESKRPDRVKIKLQYSSRISSASE